MPGGREERVTVQKQQFYKYLTNQGLKRTQQREVILDAFLKAEHHLNVDDLIRHVREVDPSIGYATVYRTVNILLASGIAQEVRLSDSVRRLEPLYEDEHHDHLICVRCGRAVEFFSRRLEALQTEVAATHGFKTIHHSLKIYGVCRNCLEAED